MRSHLDDPAILHANDARAGAQGLEPVCDNDHRAALNDLAHVLLDDALAFIVERACGFVEDQHWRVGGERARDGDALALPA